MLKNKIALSSIFFLISACTFLLPAYAKETKPYVAGGIHFDIPEDWSSVTPQSSMRLFEFEIPGSEGSETAVMTVFYFGAGRGGSIESNIERWQGQFTRGEGDALSEIIKLKVNGLDVTTVYLEGAFNGGMGPSGPKADYAALGAIVEEISGAVFFKLTGPKSVVRSVREDFEKTFVANIRSLPVDTTSHY